MAAGDSCVGGANEQIVTKITGSDEVDATTHARSADGPVHGPVYESGTEITRVDAGEAVDAETEETNVGTGNGENSLETPVAPDNSRDGVGAAKPSIAAHSRDG